MPAAHEVDPIARRKDGGVDDPYLLHVREQHREPAPISQRQPLDTQARSMSHAEHLAALRLARVGAGPEQWRLASLQ